MTHNEPSLRQAAAIDALAAGPLDSTDVDLIAKIAAVYDSVDPMPSDLIERLQFQLTLDLLHAELAELQHLSTGELAGARSEPDEMRSMTFTSDSLTIMISVGPVGSGELRIDGWVAPGAGVEVELRQMSSSSSTYADADGRFVFDHAPRGLSRIVVRSPDQDASAVMTPAVDL